MRAKRKGRRGRGSIERRSVLVLINNKEYNRTKEEEGERGEGARHHNK
jgi:hypothetical protein